MILDLTLEKDKKTNKILSQASGYQPSEEVKYRTGQVMRDFGLANEIRNKPRLEFNDLSLINRMNLDQMSWNQYVTEPSSDPAQAWRSRAFRPIVRNKIISIAAHLTAAIIYPVVYALRDDDMEDKDAATVMRDLIEWVTEQYHYDQTFVYAVIAALVNPACFIHTEFCEQMREVKEKVKDGWKKKEILDDVFSGFQSSVVPCDEMWIADFYTHDIQKQPYLIWRRVLSYSTAREKYNGIEAFKSVKPGIQFLYNDDSNTFYEVSDESLRGVLVEEVIYYNRSADLQLRFVNGILMDDVDQPNPRNDKRYPFVKTGYELIDGGRFFYYKSLAFKLAPDEEVVNTLYRMITDGTYLQIMPPGVAFGTDDINSQVIAPGMVTTLSGDNPNASYQSIQTNNNLTAGFNLINKVESSMSESSSDALLSGQAQPEDKTAFEISRVEENSKVMLGLFAKMVGFMVRDLGGLLISDILQFLTVAEVMGIEGEVNRLKFRSFLLPEKTIDGKTKTRKIEFDKDLPMEMDEGMEFEESFKIFEKEQEFDKMQIYRVNPTIFREMKFRVAVKPEALFPKSDALKKALQLEQYALAMNNPLTNKEAVTRDLLLGSFEKTKDDPDRYMAEAAPEQPGMPNPANLPTDKPNINLPFNLNIPS